VTNATASRIYGTVSAERQKEMSGLEFVQGLATGTLPLNMIAKTLGYDVIEAEKGRVVVAVEPSEGHLNPYGRVHGGLTATLLDSCMGLAVQSTLEKGFGQTTVEFKISLSPDARCNRFMHPLREPSSELLRQFTHVDYTNHVALVAQTFVDNRENVIGEARYVRVAEPSSAEISMSVADPWQRNGLAETMLAKLECRAAADGIRRLIAETLAANEKLLSFARHAGFSESCAVRGVIRLEKTLFPDHAGSQDYLTARPAIGRSLSHRPLLAYRRTF
jgi:uncharacterized protein (TIGR00369 family)